MFLSHAQAAAEAFLKPSKAKKGKGKAKAKKEKKWALWEIGLSWLGSLGECCKWWTFAPVLTQKGLCIGPISRLHVVIVPGFRAGMKRQDYDTSWTDEGKEKRDRGKLNLRVCHLFSCLSCQPTAYWVRFKTKISIPFPQHSSGKLNLRVRHLFSGAHSLSCQPTTCWVPFKTQMFIPFQQHRQA